MLNELAQSPLCEVILHPRDNLDTLKLKTDDLQEIHSLNDCQYEAVECIARKMVSRSQNTPSRKPSKGPARSFERKRRRVESSQQVLEKGSTATLSTDPFETPFGNPIGSRRPPSPIENVDCRRLVLGYKIDL